MNPYRPKTVNLFDHVIHFSLTRLIERMTVLQSPFPGAGDAGKDGLGIKKDYIAGFLEAKQLYPHVVADRNIVMYILTNVRLFS